MITIKIEYERFIKNSLDIFKSDTRLIGLAAAGSYITRDMDEYSDLDLVIAVEPGSASEIMHERIKIANKLGNLISAFTGEHVGEPRLLICLYHDPLIHVDLKFVSLNDMAHRVEELEILWERDRLLTEKFQEEKAIFPNPDLQWIEDRFWTWIHYGAGKIGRGEIFETIEFISFLRQMVIGPLILLSKGKQPRGVRKIETVAPEYLDRLKQTIVSYDRKVCCEALKVIIELYKELRDIHRFEGFIFNGQAEQIVREYLKQIEVNC
ncbi:MAG: oxalate:formate antiporter [Peptococcaceae bacterium]